jgi:hypothetical protein
VCLCLCLCNLCLCNLCNSPPRLVASFHSAAAVGATLPPDTAAAAAALPPLSLSVSVSRKALRAPELPSGYGYGRRGGAPLRSQLQVCGWQHHAGRLSRHLPQLASHLS